jgi:hypothetical protein
MPWNVIIPPAARANTTAQLDNHPTDHNQLSAALTNIVSQFRARGPLAVTTDAAGKFTVTFSPAFPAGVVPIVVATFGGFDNVMCVANPITNTGCTFTARRSDGTYVVSFAGNVSYIAIAPTS